MQEVVRGGVSRRALKIARKVTRSVWEEEKGKEKIMFQSKKRVIEKEKRQVYDLGDGAIVKIRDEVLEEDKVGDVIAYGGVELSEEEKKILRLPTGFKVVPLVNGKEALVEIEAAAKKGRMNIEEKAREEEKEERLRNLRVTLGNPGLMEEESRVRLPGDIRYDQETRKIDFSGARAHKFVGHKTGGADRAAEKVSDELKIQEMAANDNASRTDPLSYVTRYYIHTA